jgi:hypothetical protein
MITDWTKLAQQLGLLNNSGEIGGTRYAQEALDEILGDEWIESTVEFILENKSGQELAMNCLRHLHSSKATIYSYKVYKTSVGQRAQDAIWLIKHLANPIAFKWIEEFLNDVNVIHWGIGVLDQLLFTQQMDYNERCELLLEIADRNSKGQLKEQTNFIRQYVDERNNR